MKKVLLIIGVADIRFLYVINRNLKCRFLDLFMPYITNLGSASFMIAIPSVMILNKKIGLRLLGIELLISLSISHMIVFIIKRLVNRPRPWIKFEDVNSYGIKLYNYSFPSGHTTAAFSTAMALICNFKVLWIIFLPLAILIGISRIYLGVHYPTDVLIGSIIGTTTAILVHNIIF